LGYPNAVPPLYGRRSGFIARQRDFRAAVVASCSTFVASDKGGAPLRQSGGRH
jgi:hypothetical protein